MGLSLCCGGDIGSWIVGLLEMTVSPVYLLVCLHANKTSSNCLLGQASKARFCNDGN